MPVRLTILSQTALCCTFAELCAELYRPGTPKTIGNYLGVSAETVQRWQRHDSAPMAARAALYWHTSHGKAELMHWYEGQEAIHAGYVQCLRDQLAAATGELERLRARLWRDGMGSAANAPTYASVRTKVLPLQL